jgi:hypothetical protein
VGFDMQHRSRALLRTKAAYNCTIQLASLLPTESKCGADMTASSAIQQSSQLTGPYALLRSAPKTAAQAPRALG